MRKNLLALSIAAAIGGLGLAGGAHAGSFASAEAGFVTNATGLQVNGDGLGHILLYPYYTVQNGQSTLVTLVNHDATNGKAVKVRFRGASNSDDVFDFTLFLSPGDVWTANISQGANGAARLITADASCTLPATVRTSPSGSSFVTDRLGEAGVAGTREGYIEVLTMADVPPNVNPPAGETHSRIYTATKHVNGVAPCTAAAFAPLLNYANIDTHDEVTDLGFRAPSGQLSGTWTIIDVPNATSFSGNATAVQAVDAGGANARGRLVLFSQTAAEVTATQAADWTADPLLVGGTDDGDGGNPIPPTLQAAQYDFPDLSTPYTGNVNPATAAMVDAQVEALGDALAVTSVANEYYTNPIITGAATDWVFSMPTRRYNVAVDYTDNRLVFRDNEVFRLRTGAVGNVIRIGSQACVILTDANPVRMFDREERTRTNDFVISPGTPAQVRFCGEASVLSFNDAGGNSVLGASIARNDIDLGDFVEGWLRLGTRGATDGTGLPIIGASFQKYVHPNAQPGVMGNYGVVFPHKVTRP